MRNRRALSLPAAAAGGRARIVLGALAASCAVALAQSAPPGGPAAAAARSFRESNETGIVRELADLLSLPNRASDVPDIERNAAAASELFRKRGLAVRLLRVEGAPPAVFASLDSPGAKTTVTFYAHYDGQPVDPRRWSGDPFHPVLRDRPLEEGGREIAWPAPGAPWNPEWRLYARSAGDDKAPIIGFLAALDALRSAKIAPSVNLRFFLEGEEEAGSPHLAALLAKYRDDLRTDGWILCDGPVHQSRRPQLFFGARGVTGLELTVYGPNRGLHSGHYGNWAPNPIVRLTHLIDAMRDEDGTIRIPGFGDDVRPLSADEKSAIAAIPPVEAELEREFGFSRPESAEPLVAALQRPALNLRGISAGQVGPNAANVILPEATASIDFRLVPDQTPESVRKKVEAFVESQGYFLVAGAPDAAARAAHAKIAKLEWEGGYPPARTPFNAPFSRRVISAAQEAAGGQVVLMPILGGSIPMYLFQDGGRTPVVGVPVANHDDNQHSANENLRIRNLWDAIELYATLFTKL